MNSAPEFHPWSPSHFTVIFLTIVLPFVLAFVVRRTKSRRLERSICLTLSALLSLNYVPYVIVARTFGVDHWYKLLPLQLCAWAMIVIIGAPRTGNRRWLEVAYFWGIGGTLQAVITPNLLFFSSRRRHTSSLRDWSSDVCSSDLVRHLGDREAARLGRELGLEDDLEE